MLCIGVTGLLRALITVSGNMLYPATKSTNRLPVRCMYISTSSTSMISYRRLKLSLSLPKVIVLEFAVHGGYELSFKCVYTDRI